MWYKKLDSHIQELGHLRSNSDPCLYVKCRNDDSWIYLILYVDNMLIVGKDKTVIAELKEKLHRKFSMKELENSQHTLNIRID